MPETTERYADGRRKAQQAEADARYRARRRAERDYLRDVCAQLGITPSQLVTRHNAESVAQLIRAGLDAQQESQ